MQKSFKIIVFDVETGGLSPKKNPITEIALLAIDSITFQEVNRFETFIKPYNDLVIEKRALEHCHLTMAQINKGIDYKLFVKVFIQFCEELTPKRDNGKYKPILAGHNVGFDIGFLKEIMRLGGKELANYVASSGEEIDREDTLRLSRNKWKDEGKFNLTACCEKAGIKLMDSHRAMNDVIATKDLLVYHLKSLRGGEAEEKEVVESEVEKYRKTFQF